MVAEEFIIGQLAGLGCQAVGAAAAGSILDPFTRSLRYFGNGLNPDALPGLDAIISAYWRGGLHIREAKNLAAQSTGASIFGPLDVDPEIMESEQGYKRRRMWNKVLEANRPHIGSEAAMQLYRMEKLSLVDLKKILRYTGIRDGELDAVIAFLRELPLDVSTLSQLVRRDWIEPGKATEYLSRIGIIDPALRERLLALGNWIPTPTDLIRFMVRDVEDERNIDWTEGDALIPFKLQGETLKWAKWWGIDADTMKRYWRAHWVYPSPEQLYRMLWRLRPERIAQYQELVPGVKVVTRERVLSALQIDDRHPDWVRELTAISYHPVNRRDMRLLYKRKVWQKEQIASSLQDQGYIRRDATDIALAISRDVRQDDLGEPIRKTKGAIEKGLQIGALTVDDATRLLEDWGLDKEEINLTIENMRTDDVIDRVEKIIRAVGRMYRDGAMTRDQARDFLQAQGVTVQKSLEWVDLWSIELISGRKHLSAQKVIRYLFRGLLTFAEATLRLTNLGFPPEDIQVMLAGVEQDLLLARIKAAKQAAKDRAGFLKELERQARQAERERQRARSELQRHGSPGRLAKWFSRGLLDHEGAIDRLTELGWPREDSERLLREACTTKVCKRNGEAGERQPQA